MKIIAVDPGKMTGVARWSKKDGFKSWEFDVPAFYRFITAQLLNNVDGEDIRFVTEDFIITMNTARNTQAHWSLNLIGVLDYVAWAYGHPALVKQAPSMKAFGTDEKLRWLGWFEEGLGGHANDAARHLLVYAVTRRLIFGAEVLKVLATL